MTPILSGNLHLHNGENPEMRGWFAGQFIENNSPFKNDDIELKWGVHKAGEQFNKVRANKSSKSLSILISGCVSISFPEEDRQITLDKAGDYVYWDKNVFHASEVIEDSTVLTIRWPSVADSVQFKD